MWGRTARSTRRQIQKLIWSIRNAEDEGSRLTVAYIDWADAYGSVDHEALFTILKGYGFSEGDLTLLRGFYTGLWFESYTHCGTTAEMTMGRGLRQGDALSPVLFLLFVNVLLLQIRREGVGLRTGKHDVWSACFVDDVAVPSNLEGGVQRGLDLCRTFGDWAGIKLNVAKCEATRLDFGTLKLIGTDKLEMKGKMLFQLKPTDPFKYLGCRTTLDLSWRAECAAVLAKTREAVKQIRFGMLGTKATRMALDMTVILLFRYTAGIAVVHRRTGDEITKRWWSAHLAAIELPNGVSRTLLRVSHEKG
eukprot:3554258-Rhodomonas_salina.1